MGRFSDLRSQGGDSQFGRSVALLAGGTAVGQLLTLLASPVLTRLYTPEQFGVFGLFTTFLLIALLITSAQYESAIPGTSSDRAAAYLVALSLFLVVPLSLVATLVLALLKTRSWLGYGDLPWVGVALVLVSLLIGGIFSVCRYWLVRVEDFSLISKVPPLQQTARAVGQVTAGFAGLGWEGLAMGDTLGRLVGTGRVYQRTLTAVTGQLTNFSRRELRRVAAAHRRFPLLVAPSSVLDKLGALLPLPLLAQRYGLMAAGFFALVQRALGLPSALIGRSVGDVFHARIAKLKSQPDQARRLLRRTARWLLLVGAGPAVILAATGPALFSILFGEDWREAGRVAAAMTPWVLAGFVVSPVSSAVYVFEGQALKLVYDLSTLALTLGIFFVGNSSDMSLVRLVVVLSIANAATYVVYYLLLLRIVQKGLLSSVE